MIIHKYIYWLACGCVRVCEQMSKNPSPRIGWTRECITHKYQKITKVQYIGKVKSGT